MEQGVRRRFQFSLGSLLIMTAVAAVLLIPLVWVARERREMLQAQAALLDAREAALRSVVLAERSARQSAGLGVSPANDPGVSKPPPGNLESPGRPAHTDDAPTSLVKHLQRENADLKEQVDHLHREVERLKALNGR